MSYLDDLRKKFDEWFDKMDDDHFRTGNPGQGKEAGRYED